MTKIYVPSDGPKSWRKLLAEPEKQWRKGYSAKALAYSWEEADGFPREIKKAMEDPARPALNNLTPLLVIPEHKVPLPGGSRSSQNDAFVLGSSSNGLVVICVEGKVEEPFDKTISKWKPASSPGKQKRFDYLVDLLELSGQDLSHIYYQLIHRTASAIIEAQRFHARTAIMLVHSFSQEHSWFSEYREFAAVLGVKAGINRIQRAGTRSGVELYVGWVVGNSKYLDR